MYIEELKKHIKDVKDFPSKGIIFKDISPLLANGELFHETIKKLSEQVKDVDIIIGPDARGFIFGAAVAFLLNKPFVMVRKPNKLPGNVIFEEYKLEYGLGSLEIQTDLIKPNQKIAIIDDVLATGGTANCIIKLVNKLNSKVTQLVVLIELEFLKGKEFLKDIEVSSIMKVK